MPLRTFRIEEETTQKLKEIAANENVSLNAVVNRVLKEYVDVTFPAKQYDSKLIQGKLFKRTMDIIDTEQLAKIAYDMGQSTFKEFNDIGMLPMNSAGFRKIVCDVFCHSANWARYHEDRHGGKLIISLNHNMGSNWSIFLKNFLMWELNHLDDVKVKDMNFVSSDNSTAISFPYIEKGH
jgi:hypothetical protein